jgi:hypothetical protein
MHAAGAIAGKHATVEHATSKLAGTDHHPGTDHHHPYRHEPRYGHTGLRDLQICRQELYDPIEPWVNCYGPTKSQAGSKGHS